MSNLTQNFGFFAGGAPMIAKRETPSRSANNSMAKRKPEAPAQTVAELERELAQIRAERDEALARETATAEVLGVINSSHGDLAPVFQAIVTRAARLCGADFTGLALFEDGLLHLHAVSNELEQEREAWFSLFPRAPAIDFVMGRAFLEGATAHADDILSYPAFNPEIRERLQSVTGYRTALGVPILRDGRAIGAIGCNRREVRPFTERQIALLQNFAAQAVVAMENARLITETREALDQQTATVEVLQVINASPGDLAPVFEAILEKAHSLCGAALGSLVLLDGPDFRAVATRGYSREYEALARQGFPALVFPPFDRLSGGEILHNPDVREFATLDPVTHAAVEIGGIRTVVLVPLRRDGVLLGYISAQRQEVCPFSDSQIALLQNFAAQAVIAMENARLITETRDALEQQTATAEVLGVINSSPGDLQPVFDSILERAMRLCEASFGYLLTYDGERLHSAADRGHPAFAAWVRSQGAIKPEPGTTNARLVAGEDVVHIPDVADEAGFPGNSSVRRAVIEIGGFRTMLSVALRKDDALMGVLHIYRQEVRHFTDKQIALLQNFAAQAVIAMENARLLTETREALEQQTATAEVLGVINSSPGDLAPVFDMILEKAHALCGVDHGSLQLYDGEMYRAVALRGAVLSVAEQLRRARRPDPNHPTHRLFAGELFVQVPDLAEVDTPGARNMVKLAGLRTVLYVALRMEQTVLGFIGVGRKEVRLFTDKQIALLQNFAAQAVIAMENARLLGELRQRTEEVAALNRGLEARVAAQVEELGRVGSLKRFLPPQVAEMVVSQGDETILESHRREIVVVFADVRNYTVFTETAETEEVIEFLREYHAALGPLITRFEGTLSHFFGDGVMVFFNDPVPCPDPAERAVKMAMAMRESAGGLVARWRRRGHRIGFGVGIAQGFATLGQIGFAERSDYTAIGTVTNLAARLCDAAADGQILISGRIAAAVEGDQGLEEIGDLSLKGLSQAVAVYNVA